MKINPYQSIQSNPYRKQVEKQASTSETKMKKDEIQISKAALELQQSTKIDAARQEKVNELKEQIQSGNYKIDAQAIANKFYDYWNQ
ncbi:flagellar biosynthesis anti-sigma factor FlgM [Alkalihalobacterium chitinilyticum]|uniref:Negative regulator of flagellin synthesis n=1 Tax=Alkalihalobacterium chitinilyticum TaxID=2980103 RepID=A0ABT5VEZ5_9BACI|nr:flagellar biosynthesis anti-sigma factor FlgM [Alkalihalobacterium chitinilyticum]MDE5414040.1 flagellar biosynthesis anti-sigma factor FlgM [Alkalihalobacterium chitinilyticum]